jgi:hypothetical protein
MSPSTPNTAEQHKAKSRSTSANKLLKQHKNCIRARPLTVFLSPEKQNKQKEQH